MAWQDWGRSFAHTSALHKAEREIAEFRDHQPRLSAQEKNRGCHPIGSYARSRTSWAPSLIRTQNMVLKRCGSAAGNGTAGGAAATTQAVNDSVRNDLLAQAASSKQEASGAHPDVNPTVRTALDRATSRISGKFEKQPQVEAAIRATTAHAYAELEIHRESVQKMQRSLEL